MKKFDEFIREYLERGASDYEAVQVGRNNWKIEKNGQELDGDYYSEGEAKEKIEELKKK